MKIWVVGSLNIDLVAEVQRFPETGETVGGTTFLTFPGGKGGNQAVALGRLGATPEMVARIGNDDFGNRYLQTLHDAGVSTVHVSQTNREPTGTALIEVDASGNNRIVVIAGANGTMDESTVLSELDSVESGDIVLLQFENPLASVFAAARHCYARGATVILDPAPATEIPTDELSNVSWITPNEHEASVITGIDTSTEDGLRKAVRQLAVSGAQVVVKAGTRGAFLSRGPSLEPLHIPGYNVPVVDTTAAGDSFNAGLAWALSRGLSSEQAINTANAVAALSVTGMGAQTAMPNAKAVEDFLQGLDVGIRSVG